MALTFKATFRPEQRKGVEKDVPLMLDLSYRGRIWFNTGYRLFDIQDFDVSTQKLKPGKKAMMSKHPTSATVVNNHLSGIKGHLNTAFENAKALGQVVTARYLLEQMKALSGEVRHEEPAKEETFLNAFDKCVNTLELSHQISQGRKKHYRVVGGMLDRFFKIKKLTVTPNNFTKELLKDFQTFLSEEHLLIDKYPAIYSVMDKRHLPGERSQNTIAMKLKLLVSVFNYLEESETIQVNPFRKIVRRDREAMLWQSYNEPVCLSRDELLKIAYGEVPSDLKRVRACFVLQCALGCRVEDFHSFTWGNINTDNGFFVLHYVPAKTSSHNDLWPIDTPIVKFGADILLEYREALPGLLAPIFKGNVSGMNGYNTQIKKLLKHFNIDRKVIIRDGNGTKSLPVHELGSSKLARKTNVDILTKSELNKFISGLHTKGSKAADRYTHLSIVEKYHLFRLAFDQPEYSI